jgi:hypothetical protein
MTAPDRIASRPPPELRCSYCHGSAVGVDACAGCGTLTHPECRADAGRCVTIGCFVRVPVRIEWAAQPKKGSRALFVVLALIASCLIWAAVTPFHPPHSAEPVMTIKDKITDGDIR